MSDAMKALQGALFRLGYDPGPIDGLWGARTRDAVKALHDARFLIEHFPRGTGFPEIDLPQLSSLPVADVNAFSIDDITTTEIDFTIRHRADVGITNRVVYENQNYSIVYVEEIGRRAFKRLKCRKAI